jgi:hypothetical protein
MTSGHPLLVPTLLYLAGRVLGRKTCLTCRSGVRCHGHVASLRTASFARLPAGMGELTTSRPSRSSQLSRTCRVDRPSTRQLSRTCRVDRPQPSNFHELAVGRAAGRKVTPGDANSGDPGGSPLFRVFVRRRPTLPHRPRCSTIGAGGLSFRVRNGSGRFPAAMAAVTLWN